MRQVRFRIEAVRNSASPPGKGSTLGSRLQWTRSYLGLSQEEFAEEIVTPNYYRRIKGCTIERWENNTSNGMRRSVSLIGGIAASVGIDASWLAFGEGNPFRAPPEPGVYVTPSENGVDSRLEVWGRGGRRLLFMQVSPQIIEDSRLVATLNEWFGNYDPPPELRLVIAD